MEPQTLQAITRQAVGGDARALAQLIDELAPVVVRTTRLIVGAGSGVAEDAAQEALADLARGIGALREPDAVVAWAARIAARRALRAARFERLRRQREVELRSVVAPEPGEGRRAALSVAFDRLPRRQRAVAVLRLYVGLSERETAEALGISVGAVKSQLHEARAALASSLRAAGLAPAIRTKPTEGTT